MFLQLIICPSSPNKTQPFAPRVCSITWALHFLYLLMHKCAHARLCLRETPRQTSQLSNPAVCSRDWSDSTLQLCLTPCCLISTPSTTARAPALTLNSKPSWQHVGLLTTSSSSPPPAVWFLRHLTPSVRGVAWENVLCKCSEGSSIH